MNAAGRRLKVPGMRSFVDVNPLLCEVRNHHGSQCVIDGANVSHSLWNSVMNGLALSDVPAYAEVVRNFFKTFLHNDIEPTVCVYYSIEGPEAGDSKLSFGPTAQLAKYLKRMQELYLLDKDREDGHWCCFSSHGRFTFGEIVCELGIRNGQSKNAWNLARNLNAFMVSQNSRNFFEDVPFGFVNTDWLDISSLQKGPLPPIMKTYFLNKLLNDIGPCEKEGRFNEEILPMFLWLVKYSIDREGMLEHFVRKHCSTKNWPNRIRLTYKANPYHRRYIDILNMLAGWSQKEALNYILGSAFPSDLRSSKEADNVSPDLSVRGCDNKPSRERLAQSYKHFREMLAALEERGPTFRGWFDFSFPRTNLYEQIKVHLIDLLFEYDYKLYFVRDEWRCRIDAEGSDSDSDDDDADDEDDDCESDQTQYEDVLHEPPEWFMNLMQAEGRFGEHGNKFESVLHVLSTGCFFPPYFLQDPEKLSSSLASLHIRKILYGILFQDYYKQYPNGDIYIQEHVNRKSLAKLFECQVYPVWKIVDRDAPAEQIVLPGLREVESRDLDERRYLFNIALVACSSWTKQLLATSWQPWSSPECPGIYRLLVLKCWAMHAVELRRLHVVALLLSILIVEERFGHPSDMFPWPVCLTCSNWLMKRSLLKRFDAEVNLKLLQPIAQLQSIAADATNLNAALNQPYGARVDRLQTFISELVFYNMSELLEQMEPTEVGDFLLSILDDISYINFVRLVNLIYDRDEVKGRYIVVPTHLLEKVDFEHNKLMRMTTITTPTKNLTDQGVTIFNL